MVHLHEEKPVSKGALADHTSNIIPAVCSATAVQQVDSDACEHDGQDSEKDANEGPHGQGEVPAKEETNLALRSNLIKNRKLKYPSFSPVYLKVIFSLWPIKVL